MKLYVKGLLGTLGLILFLNVQAQEFTRLTKEQRDQESQHFRQNYQLFEEMKTSSKSHLHLVREVTENHIEKQKTINKSTLDSKQLDRMSHSYAAGLYQSMAGDKYVVKVAYNNDNNYPILYGGSSTFRDNKDISFTKTKTNEILNDFLGEDHSALEAKIFAVTEIIALEVKINNPEQFDLLLEDPRLLSIKHVGNPPDANLIFVND